MKSRIVSRARRRRRFLTARSERLSRSQWAPSREPGTLTTWFPARSCTRGPCRGTKGDADAAKESVSQYEQPLAAGRSRRSLTAKQRRPVGVRSGCQTQIHNCKSHVYSHKSSSGSNNEPPILHTCKIHSSILNTQLVLQSGLWWFCWFCHRAKTQ